MKHRLLLALLGLSLAGNLAFLLFQRRNAEAVVPDAGSEVQGKSQPLGACALLLGDSPEETSNRLAEAGLPPPLLRAVVSEQIAAKYRAEYDSLILRRDALRGGPNRFVVKRELDEARRLENQLDAFNARTALDVRALLGPSPSELACLSQYPGLSPEKKLRYLDLQNEWTLVSAAEPVSQERWESLLAEERALLGGVRNRAFENSKAMAKLTIGYFEPSEAEAEIVRRFCADQQAVPREPDFQGKVRALEQRLEEELGSSRYLDYQKADTVDYQTLRDLCRLAQLPKEKADQVMLLRSQVGEESVRIMNDPQLNDAQTRDTLKALASKARSAMLDALGTDVGKVFVEKRASWLKNLEDGQSVSFQPKGFCTSGRKKDPPRQ